jgi:site-specific DNA recombinase
LRAIAYLLYEPGVALHAPSSQVAQEEQVSNFCRQQEHSLNALFTDPAGGQDTTLAGLDGMFRYLRHQDGEFLVLVNDPLHLGDTPQAAVDTLLRVDALGSRVVCIADGSPDPLLGLLNSLTTSSPGTERRQRIIQGMQARALRGEVLGRPPYGYGVGKDARLEEVPQEVQVVRQIFHLYTDENMGLRALARHLNESGSLTRAGRSWSVVSLRDILRNRAYIGTYHRFGLSLPGSHPPLVSSELFRRVQDLMRSRSPRRSSGDAQPFLLSGLAYCAQCGSRMIGVTRRQIWRRMSGQRMRGTYRYYQCHARANQSLCSYHTWRAADLEETVLEQMRRRMQSEQQQGKEQQPSIPRSTPQSASPTPGESQRRRFIRYVKQATNGTITLRRLRALLERLKEERSSADMDIPPITANSIDASRWNALDFATRRVALQQWLKRVVVRDDEIEVHLRED